MTEEGAASESVPDLKDIEVKIGRKTPEGLLRWMRDEATLKLADAGRETGRKSLDDKIRKLRMEMAHLRSVDVKILQQLLAVHEGIEAVKWLLEERSTLTSRCSSLTSSQYSLGEGPDTSWRGSWSSLQDPNDKLDNISIGSYLDTLADDLDEYCPSSSESVICSATPLASEASAGGRTAGRGTENGTGVANGTDAKGGAGHGVSGGGVAGNRGTGTGKPAAPAFGSPKAKSEAPKPDVPVWAKAPETNKGSPVFKDNGQTGAIRSNGVPPKPTAQTGGSPTRSGLGQKKTGSSSPSPKLKPYKNGKMDLDTCKMNGKMHLEYDAHWRWVQSQEDVTFL